MHLTSQPFPNYCPCRLERTISSKAASLPPEPAEGGEGVVHVLVRLPGGSRVGRRFHRTDQLQVGARHRRAVPTLQVVC